MTESDKGTEHEGDEVSLNSENGLRHSSTGRTIEIEASWAPKDPRDRLYDSDASVRERTMSMVRIIAAFHPVLNVFVLLSDMARRAPLSAICVITVLALLIYWFLGQPNSF